MLVQTHSNKSQPHLLFWSEIDRRYRWPILLFIATLVGGVGWSAYYHYQQVAYANHERLALLSETVLQQKALVAIVDQPGASASDSKHSQELVDTKALNASQDPAVLDSVVYKSPFIHKD